MVITHVEEEILALGGAGTTYVGCGFSGLAGQGLDLSHQTFEDCRFDGCQMPLADVAGARFLGTTFRSCDLMGIDWTAAGSGAFGLLEPLRFADCRLDHAALVGMRLAGAVLLGCSLVEADLERAVLTGADLRFTDLSGARFGGADLTDADLRGATGYRLDPAVTALRGVRVSVPEALSVLEVLGMQVDEEGRRPTAAQILDDPAPR